MNWSILIVSLVAVILISWLLERLIYWLAGRRANLWVEKALQEIKGGTCKSDKKLSDTYMAESNEGFEIIKQSSGDRIGLRWNDVQKIVAYKREICSVQTWYASHSNWKTKT